MTIKVGTKFVCSECQSEFIVIKGSAGHLTCCNKSMEEKPKAT